MGKVGVKMGCRRLEIHRWSGTTGESSWIVLHFGGKQALPLRCSSEDGYLRLGGEEPEDVGTTAILFVDHLAVVFSGLVFDLLRGQIR